MRIRPNTIQLPNRRHPERSEGPRRIEPLDSEVPGRARDDKRVAIFDRFKA